MKKRLTVLEVEEKIDEAQIKYGEKFLERYEIKDAIEHFEAGKMSDEQIHQTLREAAEEWKTKKYTELDVIECYATIGDFDKLKEIGLNEWEKRKYSNAEYAFKKALKIVPSGRKTEITDILSGIVDDAPVKDYYKCEDVIKVLELAGMDDEIVRYGQRISKEGGNRSIVSKIYGKYGITRSPSEKKKRAKMNLQDELDGLNGKRNYSFNFERAERVFSEAGKRINPKKIKKLIIKNNIKVGAEDIDSLGFTEDERVKYWVKYADDIIDHSEFAPCEESEYAGEIYIKAGHYPHKAIDKLIRHGDSFLTNLDDYPDAIKFYEYAKKLIERAESSKVRGE